ncbi:TPA: hypothetical protein DEB00_02935 [Candidatus Uhrbacteria bacterium]|nr:hypothetical protein [Candidatus Uhrbacteria bacterium]
MARKKRVERVGPEPLPEHLYASRQLPVRRALFWGGRFLIFLLGICLLLGVFMISLYQIPAGDKLLNMFGRVVPIPAIRVNTTRISFQTYQSMVDGWTELYQQQGTLDESTMTILRERVADRLIQEVLLSDLAKELEVRVSQENTSYVQQMFFDQYENEARYEEALYEQFRWTPEEFERFVIEPLAQVHALDAVILWSEQVQETPRAMIEEMHQELTRSPDQFTELATQVSGSLSAFDGGELGLRPIKEYPQEAQMALQATKKGELTPIIELEDRFLFYRVLEQQAVDGDFSVNAQELSVAKRDVYDVLNERLGMATITYYIQL